MQWLTVLVAFTAALACRQRDKPRGSNDVDAVVHTPDTQLPAKVKATADQVCACRDKACAMEGISALRGYVESLGAADAAHATQIQRDVERAGKCVEKLTTTTRRLDMEGDVVCPTDNDEARAAYNKGRDATGHGDDAAAEAAYKRALELDPEYCDAMDNLGALYRGQGRVDEAIALYERSVAIAPENAVAWQNLGVAYRVQKRMDDAIAAYAKLVDLDPANPEGWFGLGQVQLIGEHTADAITSLSKAEQLYAAAGSRYIDDARLLLGLAHGRSQNWKPARDLLEPLYDKHGDDAEINLHLGAAYVIEPSIRDATKARRYLERARTLGATVPPVLWDELDGQK